MLRTTLIAAVATAALCGFQAVQAKPAHAAAPGIETAPCSAAGAGDRQRPSAGWGSVDQIIDAAAIVNGLWS